MIISVIIMIWEILTLTLTLTLLVFKKKHRVCVASFKCWNFPTIR